MSRILSLAGLLMAIFLIAAGQAVTAASGNSPSNEAISSALADLLSGNQRMPLPIERIKPALQTHYVKNRGAIYWVGTGRMTPFIQRLEDAEDDGLNPGDYPIDSLIGLRDAVAEDDPRDAAIAELYFSTFFVAYASDLKIGRVTPSKVDPQLFRNRKTVDPLAILTDLQKQRDPNKFLSAFESRNPQYQALKKMLRLYRAMAQDGNWPTIDTGPNIAPGGSDARLPAIRKLLALTGDYSGPASTSPVYDSETVAGVKHFQLRNGLEAKGLIGKQTIFALGISPDERVRQITLNMERWRWMPENLGDYHFLVNLAAFELQRVRDLAVVERMQVVVGAVATSTPEFSADMAYVVINPTWTVPYSIATKEMLPKLRGNPFAYATDFDIFMRGQLVSWGGIDWNSYGPGNFPFTFRQRPGPKNALGRVKFMLPNKHDIYLHDSPAKDKFLATTRAFSHGCIRLSRPIDLAYTVLGENAGWSKQKVEQALASDQTVQVPLAQKIPVHLLYSTAFYGANGIEFRPDIYGRDRKLYAALFGRPAS